MRRYGILALLLIALVMPVGAATVHVDVGPKTCAGGSNNGTDCHDNTACTGGGTCTGTSSSHFLDDTSQASSTTTITKGDEVQWDWIAGLHDVAGGTECTDGGTSGSPTDAACDPGDGICSGGSNNGGNCDPDDADATCPGGICSGDKECFYCTGGDNDGHLCPFGSGCTGGGTCSHASHCSNALAETWDAGGSFSPTHTLNHTFNTLGSFPYICSLHFQSGGTRLMIGTVVVQCGQNSDCDDGNFCTSDTCSVGVCEYATVTAGSSCPVDGKCAGQTCVHTKFCVHTIGNRACR